MKNLITIAWEAILRIVRPGVDDIIATFLKAQLKLQGVIDRELKQTMAETDAIAGAYQTIENLMTSRDARNAVIDRAYRVIHKLDVLTA